MLGVFPLHPGEFQAQALARKRAAAEIGGDVRDQYVLELELEVFDPRSTDLLMRISGNLIVVKRAGMKYQAAAQWRELAVTLGGNNRIDCSACFFSVSLVEII